MPSHQVLAVVALGYVVSTSPSSGASPSATTLPHGEPLHLVARLGLPCVIPTVGALVALIAWRKLFSARAPRGSARTLAGRLVLLAVGTTAADVGVGLLAAGQWQTAPTASIANSSPAWRMMSRTRR